jgi:hypothetical protein
VRVAERRYRHRQILRSLAWFTDGDPQFDVAQVEKRPDAPNDEYVEDRLRDRADELLDGHLGTFIESNLLAYETGLAYRTASGAHSSSEPKARKAREGLMSKSEKDADELGAPPSSLFPSVSMLVALLEWADDVS